MKKEDMFTLLGEVDEQKVVEAANAAPRIKKFSWLKWGTMAACLCLVVAGAYHVHINSDNDTQKESVIEQHGINKNDVESETNLPTEQETDTSKNQELPDAEDRPADEDGTYHESHSGELKPPMADIFCGSYTDSRGQFVVVLIEDTPQNRLTACKELGIKENQVSFQTGTYTLQYLTELQGKISEGMIQKNLPFVVTSSINEISNRITISVTTKDETLLKEVLALDTIGGAIEILYSKAAIQEIQEDVAVLE